ncbi:tyrosine-type recombinase/integrase [Flavobacterium kingsejongi]|nr:tyrosine-type recombinase/integrase [Flavobacterium kingsejongi]
MAKLACPIHLCKYMCSLGIECYIPKTPKSGWQNDYIPYIYTHEEVRIIFSISDNLRILKGMDRTPMFILPALCRLLYSTGIRIGEALSIKNEDVDYENKIIHIRKSKNDKERLAVINDSLLSVLEQYRDYRNKIPFTHVSSPSSHFFLTQLGKPCSYGNILTWFHKILYFGKIPKQAYFNRPRIHDIRHTTAVHTLEKLVKDGMDIYCALPLISAFLGHKCIRSTETYVKLTHEMFPDIIEAEALTSYIFPSQPSKTDDNYDGFC